MCEEGMGVFGSMPSVEVCKERGEGEYSCGENGPCTQSPQGNCKGRCEDEVPRCMDDWNAMCEEGMGVFGSMPSVEVCKERGEGEYSCGENGPCTQSPTGNCKGRCEDEVPRCMDECDNPCEGDDCPKSVCKAACNDNGGYQQRAADKAPMWEGDVGSCKNQCHRFANSPTYQDEAPSSDDG